MNIEVLFLVVGSIIGMGFLSSYLFKRTRVPDILLLVLLGLLIGPVFNVFPRAVFLKVVPHVSALALLMILFNGGLNLNLDKLIHTVPRATALALLGFLFSSLSIGFLSWIILGLQPLLALLLGVIVGGVSSTIVIPVVSELDEFREDPRLILDLESVITDPLCIIVAIVLMGIITGQPASSALPTPFPPALSRVISMFSVSLVSGFGFGMLWLEVLRHIKGEKHHYMLTLSFLFFVYAITQIVGGNGAIASFMVGLILGNAKRVKKMLKLEKKYYGLTEKTKGFQDQISFFVKTFFFVILGVIITFKNPRLFLYGGIFALVILGTRYLAVEISVIGADFKSLEKDIMTFMTPRGLASAVLASIFAVEYSVEGSSIFTEIAFSVILGTALVSTVGIFIIERKVKNNGDGEKSGDGEQINDVQESD